MSEGAKVATLTLNPAIDRTVQVANFAAGEVNRVSEDQSDAGGKGINVASFLSHVGHKVAVSGLLGKDNLGIFEELFVRKGIDDHFIRMDGATRVNVKIVDPALEQVTDLNFPGLGNCGEAEGVISETLIKLVSSGIETIVLAGSLPAGLPTTYYRDLTILLKELGCKVILDASGPSFAEAMKAGPNIIKPNIDELSELVGRPLVTPEDVVTAAREANEGEIELIVVSMGADGAIFIKSDEVLLAKPPKAIVKSTVGAGDAMVAGIVHGLSEEKSLSDVACLATGFSLGALGEIGPHLPPREAIEAFAAQVTLQHLKF
ncbi:1-phosphofructokinase [Cohaesibacter celericrescens]|uniref:1-phosphofructokinase n=1 Tax=Cohaesibacter celericrescens TaxID=2067669 RepID=UPI0035666F71